jgi:hypothetical protein
LGGTEIVRLAVAQDRVLAIAAGAVRWMRRDLRKGLPRPASMCRVSGRRGGFARPLA